MLTCKEYAEQKKKELKQYISEKGLHPCLVVIQVGDDPASNSYIRGKMRDCEEVGIECGIDKLDDDISENNLVTIIQGWNQMPNVHGIIVQLPLPDHINVKTIQASIDPKKDVDGFDTMSPFDPCTPAGVIGYLKAVGYEFEGKDALVIGRSDIVGKPLARMLTDLDCTVTLAHSKSKYMRLKMDYADIVFSCIDKIEYFGDDYIISSIKSLIDIGLGVGEDGKLHGNFKSDYVDYLKKHSCNSIIISGTGGVGLLTRVALLENVVKACDEYAVPVFLGKTFTIPGLEL